MKTAWITKYALTKGIVEVQAEPEGLSNDAIRVTSGEYAGAVFSKDSWRDSHEGAVSKAEDMRKKKIQSLQKQVDQLTRMRFE